MTANTQKRLLIRDGGYFGWCPECDPETDEEGLILNVRDTHFMVCEKHKTAWCIGDDLFSRWRDETQELWDANLQLLESEHRRVEPCYWPDATDCQVH